MNARLQTIIALAIVFLRTRRLRRSAMFWIAIVVMGMVFVGGWMIPEFLERHPLTFAIFWLICLAQVVFLILLSGYDMLMTPRELRAEALSSAPAAAEDNDENANPDDDE